MKGRGAIGEIPERLQSGHRGCEAVGGRLLAVGNAVGAGVGVWECLWGRVRAGVLGGRGSPPPPFKRFPGGGGAGTGCQGSIRRGGEGCNGSGCNVRIRLQPHLLPTAFTAYCPLFEPMSADRPHSQCLVCSLPAVGGGGWHKASVFGCLPLAAPIGLSPLLILTLCGSERVLVVSTEPPDDLSCLTTPGVGCPGDGAVARAVWGRGGGSGTQKFVYQKWPDQIFPIAKFVFPHECHFGLGGGGGATPPPPTVYGHSNTCLRGARDEAARD